MSYQTTDRIYQRMLRYEHHQENYRNSLLNNITPYGLQLKKKAQIETISENFSEKWQNVLYDAERKLVQLLLTESELIYNKMDRDLNDIIRTTNPESVEEIKNEIMNRNLTLKVTLNERRVRKWHKFKRKKRVAKSTRRTSKVSDYVEIALRRPTMKNVTDNRKHRKRILKQQIEIGNNTVVTTDSNITTVYNNDVVPVDKSNETQKNNFNNKDSADIGKNIVSISVTGNLILPHQNDSTREQLVSDEYNIVNETEENKRLDQTVSDKDIGREINSINNKTLISLDEKGLGDVSLSQKDTSLVNILASLLHDDSSVQVVTPSIVTSTAGNNSTQGRSIICSEVEQNMLPAKSGRIKGYFCSDTIFNLSNKFLNETEIRVLEKGLGFVPTPNMINEEDLRRDFNEFSRKMRCKWYFRNEPSNEFSEIPAFRPKSNWKPPAGHPCVELFLSKMEHELFSFLPGKPQSYNLTREEWEALKNLKEDRSIIIKPADKGSCVVVWDREDYLAEGYMQLNDKSTYVEINNFKGKFLRDLTDKSNNFFKRLCKQKTITEKELKYFSYSFKNASCLGKMYLLPKIHERLFDVPGRPVISNCGTPTEKVSEFLDHHLQPVMKSGKSYVKDTGDFIEK